MKPEFQKLYDCMLSEISLAEATAGNVLTRIEKVYRISTRYWNKVQSMLRHIELKEQNEQIEFFKVVKPTFTFHIEFAILMYEVMVAINLTESTRKFWQDEEKRYHRFLTKHQAFITYMEEGRSDLDHIYFVRSPKNPGIGSNTRMYDLDGCLYSPHSLLLSRWRAWKKYKHYIDEKIRK